MSTLNIRYYDGLAAAPSGKGMPVGKEDDNTLGEDVAFSSGVPGESAAFPSRARLVRVIVDADAYLEFGAAPAVAAGSLLLPAGSAEYFSVNPGDKVAVESVV